MAGVDGRPVAAFLSGVESARGHLSYAADSLAPLTGARGHALDHALELVDTAALYAHTFRSELRAARMQVSTADADTAARMVLGQSHGFDASLAALRQQLSEAPGEQATIDLATQIHDTFRAVAGSALDDVVRGATTPGAEAGAQLGAAGADGHWTTLSTRLDNELDALAAGFERNSERLLDEAEDIIRSRPSSQQPSNQFTLDDGTLVIKGNIFDKPDHLIGDPQEVLAAQLNEHGDNLAEVLSTQTPRLTGGDLIRAEAADQWARLAPQTSLPHTSRRLPTVGEAVPMDQPVRDGEYLYTTIVDDDIMGPAGEYDQVAVGASFPIADLGEFIASTKAAARPNSVTHRWVVMPRESGGWNVVEIKTPVTARADGHTVPINGVSPNSRAIRMQGRAIDGIVSNGEFMRFDTDPNTPRSTEVVYRTEAGRMLQDLAKKLRSEVGERTPTEAELAAKDQALLDAMQTRWIADWLTVPQPGERAGSFKIHTDTWRGSPDGSVLYDLPLTFGGGDVQIVRGERGEAIAAMAANERSPRGIYSIHQIDPGVWGIAPVTMPGMSRKMLSDIVHGQLRGIVEKADGVDGLVVVEGMFKKELPAG